MATVENGAAGKFRGRLNDVVLSKWMGIDVARKLPSKSKKKPKQATIEKRHRFGMVSHVLKQFSEATKIGYPSNRKSCSSMNLAVKSALKEAVIGAYPDWSLDPAKIRLSGGVLAQVYNVKGELDKDDAWKFNIEWQNPYMLSLGVSEYDRLQIFVLIDKNDEIYSRLYQDAGYRSENICSIKLPKAGRVSMQVWMFLLSKDGKEASPTAYIGKFTF